MPPDPAVLVRELHFDYGARPALAGVSFSIRPDRFTAMLGPNGAGKTTLISLLTGLLTTSRGEIAILGQDVRRRPRSALARLGIVFQSATLDLDLTVRQNMRYSAALRGLAGHQTEERIAAALERMGLAGRAGDKARTLNGGHRRRLEIARALVHSPQLLILDEPTVGLDVHSRADLVDHVHGLCGEGLTVLWATHLVDEVWETDDLVVLNRGTAAAAGSVIDVLGKMNQTSVLGAFNALTDNDNDNRVTAVS